MAVNRLRIHRRQIVATTLLEKKPKEEILNEGVGRELFGPEFVNDILADMRRFAEGMEPFFAGLGLKRRTLLPAPFVTTAAAPWTPTIEMFYTEGAIVVRAELPGVDKEQVKAEIVEGALIIQGERKYEKEATKKGYFTTECAYGTFYRRIPLPEEVKVNEAKAVFKNGILEITIPAPALEAKPARKLEITAV
jgi:HSP20 family protein